MVCRLGTARQSAASAHLAPGSVYIDVGDEFGILNLSTGVVTPIFTGVSPHGADFVSFAEVPEPSTAELALAGLFLFGASFVVKSRMAGYRTTARIC